MYGIDFINFGRTLNVTERSESVKILNNIYATRPNLVTVKVYANSDHFIKKIPQGNNFDFPKYADNYVNDLTEWILEQANEIVNIKNVNLK